jgi:hypothetical protein
MVAGEEVNDPLARFGPTTPKQLGAVNVHQYMVTSIQTRVEPRGYFPDASVDPTEARCAKLKGAPAFAASLSSGNKFLPAGQAGIGTVRTAGIPPEGRISQVLFQATAWDSQAFPWQRLSSATPAPIGTIWQRVTPGSRLWAAWTSLPEHVVLAILALVASAGVVEAVRLHPRS